MSRKSRPQADAKPLPALYAMTHSGLEPVAADEMTRDLGGDVKKTARGVVVFRLDEIDRSLLNLRTTEDVFLFGWGTDELSFRAVDLESIRKWTDKSADWTNLLKIHHQVRPKPQGKPTFRVIVQMTGEHAYRRADARKAFWKGLANKVPASWREAEENASVEFWLTIHGQTAVAGVRLSDRTMRHRTYKREHVAASLRPTVAAAMVRLAGVGHGMTVLDPMCGAGTILAEAADLARRRRGDPVRVIGGDLDPNAVFVASQNLEKVGGVSLARWDSTQLPLGTESIDRIVCNPPFGKQLSSLEQVGPLYQALVPEWDRVLKPGGRAVFIVMESVLLRNLLKERGWKATRQLRVRLLGQPTVMSVWQKPG